MEAGGAARAAGTSRLFDRGPWPSDLPLWQEPSKEQHRDMASSPHMYKRFILPSGKVVEVRRVEQGANPEAVVREVNENDQLAPREDTLTLRFLLNHCKKAR